MLKAETKSKTITDHNNIDSSHISVPLWCWQFKNIFTDILQHCHNKLETQTMNTRSLKLQSLKTQEEIYEAKELTLDSSLNIFLVDSRCSVSTCLPPARNIQCSDELLWMKQKKNAPDMDSLCHLSWDQQHFFIMARKSICIRSLKNVIGKMPARRTTRLMNE